MLLCQSRMIEQLETRRLFASPHFISGPDYVTSDTSVEASGTIAGIGNQDLTVNLAATGSANTVAINPAGKVNPGHSGTVTATGSQTITDPKNGSTDFDVIATLPTPTSGKGSPNSKWNVQTTVTWESATLTVVQGGQTVLTDTTTF